MPKHAQNASSSTPDATTVAPRMVAGRDTRSSAGRGRGRRAAVVTAAVALAAALPAAAWSATPRKDAGYQGVSGQKAGPLALPVALRVAKNGRSVTRFDIQWTAKCASPTGRGSLGGLSVTKGRVLSKLGSFSSTTTSTRDLGNATKALFTITLKGRFRTRTRATGTFKVSVSIRDATNQQVDTCDTKTIKWSVRD